MHKHVIENGYHIYVHSDMKKKCCLYLYFINTKKKVNEFHAKCDNTDSKI